MKHWIQTYSGIEFELTTDKAKLLEQINLYDIAHALCHVHRYTGHTGIPISVAAHSVGVANLVKPKYRLAALLHDAAEAYVGDVASPLRRYLCTQTGLYEELHDAIREAVFDYVGLPPEIPAEVRKADAVMLHWEKEIFFADNLNWNIPEPEWSMLPDTFIFQVNIEVEEFYAELQKVFQ